MSKLAQLIQQLRSQEEGYVDLFQKTLVSQFFEIFLSMKGCYFNR